MYFKLERLADGIYLKTYTFSAGQNRKKGTSLDFVITQFAITQFAIYTLIFLLSQKSS